MLGVSLGVLSAPLDAVACGPEAFKDARVTRIRMFRTCMFVCIYIYIYIYSDGERDRYMHIYIYIYTHTHT